jgi:hypothetical protein
MHQPEFAGWGKNADLTERREMKGEKLGKSDSPANLADKLARRWRDTLRRQHRCARHRAHGEQARRLNMDITCYG